MQTFNSLSFAALFLFAGISTARHQALQTRIKILDQRVQELNTLEQRVDRMDKLLKKMSKGLGYDGPEYWQ